jgi:hypothetical protein
MLMKDFTTVYLLGIAHTQVIISRSACFAKSCQIPPWHVTVGHILYTSKVLTITALFWSLRTNRQICCFYFRANLNDYRLIVITDSIPLRLTVYFTSVWCWVITAYPVRMFDKASHWIFRGSKSFRASASESPLQSTSIGWMMLARTPWRLFWWQM